MARIRWWFAVSPSVGWPVAFMTIATMAFDLAAQGPVTAVECHQWDQAYARIVLTGIIGSSIGAAAMALLIGVFFGRRFWWAARPRPRIWIATFLIAFPVVEFLIVGLPRLAGFGRFFFSGVDVRYPDCS